MAPVDSAAASMLQVADTQAATDPGLAMRSRTVTGILLGALEAPRLQEVRRDFAMPQLRMVNGTRLEARTRGWAEDLIAAAASAPSGPVWATADSAMADSVAGVSAGAGSVDLAGAGAAAGD